MSGDEEVLNKRRETHLRFASLLLMLIALAVVGVLFIWAFNVTSDDEPRQPFASIHFVIANSSNDTVDFVLKVNGNVVANTTLGPWQNHSYYSLWSNNVIDFGKTIKIQVFWGDVTYNDEINLRDGQQKTVEYEIGAWPVVP